MIGILVNSSQRASAAEFFELFKTPWEFLSEGREYSVVIDATGGTPHSASRFSLVLGSDVGPFDRKHGLKARSKCASESIVFGGQRIPIYRGLVEFPGGADSFLRATSTGVSVLHVVKAEDSTIVRVGFGLFEEIEFLLAGKQPPGDAQIPVIELHIAILRHLIARAGLPLVEVPPVPAGHPFIACLTHDIDHPLIRNHAFDHTMFGFLYRATAGSLKAWATGRITLRDLARNWTAAAVLPLVHLGLTRDIWSEFDRYLELEAGCGGTYFAIPKRDDPGRNGEGYASRLRASRYEISEILPQLKRILQAGSEVGLHGVDAWRDRESGEAEMKVLRGVVGDKEVGIRMHWLFFDENSPRILDEAGFTYDSSLGYCETVGFRAGTLQAYRPLAARHLLELPLVVMDTALFYPAYLNLDEAGAKDLVWRLIDHASRLGGALTINWHDRSIFPERLWDGFYIRLLDELKRRGAWMPTASDAVGWFRKRRSAVVRMVRQSASEIQLSVSLPRHDNLPGLRVRIHRPSREGDWVSDPAGDENFREVTLNETEEISISI